MGELVTLGGYPLTGNTRDGVWKRLGDLEGWWDSPEPKRVNAPRTRGDGNFRTKIDYEPRLITFNGRVISKNHDYLHQAAGIITALPFRGEKKLLVQGHGPTQWATVDPRGKVKVDFETDTYLNFQIPLEALDPFKYGDPYTVAGSSNTPAALFHRGTVEAWPVVTVTGTSSSGYTLTLNGKSVTVTRALTSGSPHTIDFRTGILRVGGVVSGGALATTNFSPVNPGLPQNMTITVGLFTAKYFDTYS